MEKTVRAILQSTSIRFTAGVIVDVSSQPVVLAEIPDNSILNDRLICFACENFNGRRM